MVRRAGALLLVTAAALAASACATTAPEPRLIIPTMNTPTPETETMYAGAPSVDPAAA